MARANPGVDIFEPAPLGQYSFVRRLTGTPTGPSGAEVPFGGIPKVAADPTNGNIYVTIIREIYEFSSAGAYLGQLGEGPPRVRSKVSPGR